MKRACANFHCPGPGDCQLQQFVHEPLSILLVSVQDLTQTGKFHIDAGPGLRVPEEPPSHGRDSANVSGHAIPAVLHGNQYTVLFDTEPTEMEDLDGFYFSHNVRFTRIVDFCVYTDFPY